MSADILDIILDLVDQTRRAGSLPLVLLDLDSTIFDTGARNHAIVQAFLDQNSARFPTMERHRQHIHRIANTWNVCNKLRELGEDDEDAIDALQSFWADRFFTDEWVVHDRPTPGAPEYCRALHEAGALLYYMTGRHVDGMAHSTVSNLVRDGFPYFDGRSILHLKPSFEMDDTVFKTDALAQVRALSGVVVASFENEPANANMFLDNFPEGHHILLDTVHSPNPALPHPDVHTVKDFRRA